AAAGVMNDAVVVLVAGAAVDGQHVGAGPIQDKTGLGDLDAARGQRNGRAAQLRQIDLGAARGAVDRFAQAAGAVIVAVLHDDRGGVSGGGVTAGEQHGGGERRVRKYRVVRFHDGCSQRLRSLPHTRGGVHRFSTTKASTGGCAV